LVWSDRASLDRLFHELFSNAVKFTQHRAVAVISVSACESNAETVVTVRDNGTGFAMGAHCQLFGLFRRLHRRDEYDGDGVGLAMARQIIQLHHGRIWVEAEVEQGAAFHFALPKPECAGNGEACGAGDSLA
jgi:light-regulated signal transduction histidine kinase (bacteriophytochrome)